MSLEQLNSASQQRAYQLLESCCCAPNWINNMLAARPFADRQALLSQADTIWQGLSEQDYLAAFAGHPQIGDLSTLQDKYANTSHTASHEQAGMSTAEQAVLEQMYQLNKAYLEKFGFIFIVFASGKSAAQMLALLTQRIDNQRATELSIAAAEQAKITANRLEKL